MLPINLQRQNNPTNFFEGAKEGNLERVKEFIQNQGWVNLPDEKGNSALYYAAKRGHVHVVKYLLENGASAYPNLKGKRVFDRASEEVRKFLDSTEFHEIKANVEEALDTLLLDREEVVEKSTKEIVEFFTSIPFATPRNKVLGEYASHLVLVYRPDQLEEMLSLIEETEEGQQTKMSILKDVIYTSLCCGDVELAQQFAAMIPDGHPLSLFVEREVDMFVELFTPLTIVLFQEPEEFKEIVLKGVRQSNIYEELPEETISQLINELTASKVFLDALNYVKSLEDENIRGFLRSALSHILNHLAYDAREGAKEQLIEEAIEDLTFLSESEEIEKISNSDPTRESVDAMLSLVSAQSERIKLFVKWGVLSSLLFLGEYQEALELYQELPEQIFDMDELSEFYDSIKLNNLGTIGSSGKREVLASLLEDVDDPNCAVFFAPIFNE